MNRLYIISFINPSWHDQIADFLTENPTYKRLLPIVALDEYPNGFNKNPLENEPDCPRNIFETILNGLAFAGADIEYGKEQYLMMKSYFRQFDKLTEDMTFPENTQPEKVPIYRALIKKMIDYNMNFDDLTYNHMDIIESVEGMTESTITLLHLLYDETTSEKCLPYGDKQFKRGMSMFYELENPTKEELRTITTKWRNKKVGLMFVVQYAHYSEYV
jgi:hypothetical protein